MNKPLAATIFFYLFLFQQVLAQENLKLWYTKPATVWTEALPVGNGRLGAMVFGGVEEELIQLNESTLWSGGPVKSGINPESAEHLAQVREALLERQANCLKRCRVFIRKVICRLVTC